MKNLLKNYRLFEQRSLWWICSSLFRELAIPFYKENDGSFLSVIWFVPSLVKIWPVFLERIFKSCQYIFAMSLLLLLGKRCGASFKQIWIPFTQECFEWRLKSTQWYWRRNKCTKVKRNTPPPPHNDWNENR